MSRKTQKNRIVELEAENKGLVEENEKLKKAVKQLKEENEKLKKES